MPPCFLIVTTVHFRMIESFGHNTTFPVASSFFIEGFLMHCLDLVSSKGALFFSTSDCSFFFSLLQQFSGLKIGVLRSMPCINAGATLHCAGGGLSQRGGRNKGGQIERGVQVAKGDTIVGEFSMPHVLLGMRFFVRWIVFSVAARCMPSALAALPCAPLSIVISYVP